MSKSVMTVLMFALVIHVKHVDVRDHSGFQTVVVPVVKRQALSREPTPGNGSAAPEDKPATTNVTENSTDRPAAASVNVSEVHVPSFRPTHEHNGALLRSFYVFLGMSGLVLVYLSVRACRTRPGAPPPSTVRKYGVVGRRSDMEMLPLPLSEDEEDDTVFDVGEQQTLTMTTATR